MAVLPSTANLISGFIIIPIAYENSTHFMYAQARTTSKKKIASKPAHILPQGRTLFLLNIPPDATERELALLFQPCGTVERVLFDSSTALGDLGETGSNSDSDSDSDDDGDGDDDGGDSDDDDANKAQEITHTDTDTRPRKKQRKNSIITCKSKKTSTPEIIPLFSSSFSSIANNDDDDDNNNTTYPFRTFHKTGSCANIVFLDSSSLVKAIQIFSTSTSRSSQSQSTQSQSQSQSHTQTQLQRWPWPSSEEPRGLSHYLAKYDAERPPLDVIKAHADSFMERFEFDFNRRKHKSSSSSSYRKGEAIVDEQGFTLVTRGGAYGQAIGGGVGIASRRFMLTGTGSGSGSRKKKQKKKKEKDTFYGFQKAEKQRQDILDMRRNFESDKARVEKLKESRRFKPY